MKHLLTFLYLLLFLSEASAVPTVRQRFVNTNCFFSGNGTTNICGGTNGAYHRLAAALYSELKSNPDLLGSDEVLDIECKGSVPDVSDSSRKSSPAFNQAADHLLLIADHYRGFAGEYDASYGGYVPNTEPLFRPGWTTDATRKIIIHPATSDLHKGYFDPTKYHLQNKCRDLYMTCDRSISIINVDVDIRNIQFDGWQSERELGFLGATGIGVSADGPFHPTENTYTVNLDGNLFHGTRPYLRDACNPEDGLTGIAISGNGKLNINIVNNVAQNLPGTLLYIDTPLNSAIYNNTDRCPDLLTDSCSAPFNTGIYYYDDGSGFENDVQLRDNLFVNCLKCVGDFYQGNYVFDAVGFVPPAFMTTSHNISDDGTSPDAPYQNLVPSFISAWEIRLANADTVAKNQGEDLSADLIYPFDYDSILTARPQGPAFDIGGLERIGTEIPIPSPTPEPTYGGSH